jgi:hypothetical protein
MKREKNVNGGRNEKGKIKKQQDKTSSIQLLLQSSALTFLIFFSKLRTRR